VELDMRAYMGDEDTIKRILVENREFAQERLDAHT
jgi:hypothetical protein